MRAKRRPQPFVKFSGWTYAADGTDIDGIEAYHFRAAADGGGRTSHSGGPAATSEAASWRVPLEWRCKGVSVWSESPAALRSSIFGGDAGSAAPADFPPPHCRQRAGDRGPISVAAAATASCTPPLAARTTTTLAGGRRREVSIGAPPPRRAAAAAAGIMDRLREQPLSSQRTRHTSTADQSTIAPPLPRTVWQEDTTARTTQRLGDLSAGDERRRADGAGPDGRARAPLESSSSCSDDGTASRASERSAGASGPQFDALRSQLRRSFTGVTPNFIRLITTRIISHARRPPRGRAVGGDHGDAGGRRGALCPPVDETLEVGELASSQPLAFTQPPAPGKCAAAGIAWVLQFPDIWKSRREQTVAVRRTC